LLTVKNPVALVNETKAGFGSSSESQQKGWISVAKRPFKQKFGSLLCLVSGQYSAASAAALALDPQRAAARLG
jgi:hypothetical protein